jgi:hypothetical protein
MESAADLFGEIDRAALLLDNSWKVKQTDQLDQRTSHIYQCRTLDQLREIAAEKHLSEDEQLYAVHRWRNFKRHEAWQALLFEQVPSISLPPKAFHKEQDFFISSNGDVIPFDLKITRYPHTAGHGLSDRGLAEWFYQNQSRQNRFHLGNRFFVVGEPEALLYDIDLARKTVGAFAREMSKFTHFIEHPNGQTSRAVILRQLRLPITR